MELNILANLKKELEVEKGLHIIKTGIVYMKEIILMIKEKEMENFFGKMVNII